MATQQQKAQCCLWVHGSKFVTTVQCQLQTTYGEDPPDKSITCFCKGKSSAGHQHMNNMQTESEKHSCEVHISQPEEPALKSESQQPQYGVSSIRDLGWSFTSKHFQKRTQWSFLWELCHSVERRGDTWSVPCLQQWSHIPPVWNCKYNVHI